MEGNFQVARDLGYLNIPPGVIIGQEEIKRFPENKLMIIVAGSLGQPGSALSRAAHGDHKYIQIKSTDTVVFSADPMPSAEVSQTFLIDLIAKIGCKLYYSSLNPDLHVSGHAAQEELKLMINLAKPKYLLPMGGNFKHVRAFRDMVMDLGYKQNEVLTLTEVQAIEFLNDKVRLGEKIRTENIYVDGLGVGDVGNIILRDRQVMSEEGVVFVAVKVDKGTGKLVSEPDIISRGFVFGEIGDDIIDAAKEIVKSLFNSNQGSSDGRYMRKEVEGHLQKFFFSEMKRNPLILTFVAEV